MKRLRSPRWRHEHRRVLRRVAASSTALVLLGGGTALAAAATSGFGTEKVGPLGKGAYLLPDHARIDPAGVRAVLLDGTNKLPDGTPALNGKIIASTISPDGRYLGALTWNDFQGFLTIIDLSTSQVIQQVGTGSTSDPTLGDGNVSTDGPYWSPDEKSLWMGQGSDMVHFSFDASSGTVDPTTAVTIPLTQTTTNLNGGETVLDDLPAGMAFSSDGSTAYVALNGINAVGVIDTATNAVSRIIPVGNAPRQVVLSGDQLFVSDEGGRPAKPGDYTNLSYDTPIVANKVTGGATTGEVSVVDLTTGRQTKEIPVGLEPSAELLGGGELFVADSNQDSVSVIDPSTEKVVSTINVNPLPGSKTGSYPNAMDMVGNRLFVSIGRDNAIAEVQWNGPANAPDYLGLIPTDWYPVAVQYDQRVGKVVVTNDMGVGSFGPPSTIAEGPDHTCNPGDTSPAPACVTGHNTYDTTASVTEFSVPSGPSLDAYTHDVINDNDWGHVFAGEGTPNPDATPVPVPAAIGSPSTIKHVFLIIRENRTYDQIFGDLGAKADGDPALAQFGASVTPNDHKLETTYTTFDNYYDPSTLSADGHNWLVQAEPNDYIMKEFGSFVRSYPAQGGDALAYQDDGFIWNAAEQAGKTVQAFGEYNNYIRFTGPVPTWSQWYQDSQVLEGKAPGPLPVPESAQYTYADIPSLNAIDDHTYPAFDLDIPDQYRADVWLQSFEQSEKTGNLADLTLIWLPDDHTSGTTGPDPEPAAEVADNDLATGRIISAISHSQFWKSSAVFVTEDDAQNGTDHVDGHRAPLTVASPWVKRGAVNDTYYNQVSVVRTIEQMLGIQPMNQEDLAAEPMYNAFTDTPDYAPYDYVPNQVSLTAGVTPTPTASAAAVPASQASNAAPQTAGVPAAERGVYLQWLAWARGQHFGGRTPMVDWANPAQLNRYDWYSAHGWKAPYPGDKAILAPSQVPGADAPAGYGYES